MIGEVEGEGSRHRREQQARTNEAVRRPEQCRGDYRGEEDYADHVRPLPPLKGQDALSDMGDRMKEVLAAIATKTVPVP